MSCNLEPIFGVQDCCSRIAEVEYRGQTRHTRILYRKPLIDTCYRIGHILDSLELKYFLFVEQPELINQQHCCELFWEASRRCLPAAPDSLCNNNIGQLHGEICCFAQTSNRNLLICSNALFLLRDKWMIERLSEAMSTALVDNKFLLILLKIPFHMKRKKSVVTAQNLHTIKTFLTKTVSQEWQHVFLKRACRYQQQLPLTRKRPVSMLACLTRPSCAGALSKKLCCSLCYWFCNWNHEPLSVFCNSLGEWLPDEKHRLKLGLKVEPDQWVVKVYLLWNPWPE